MKNGVFPNSVMLASNGTPGIRSREGAEHFGGIERFRENRVRAGLHVEPGPGDRAIQPFAGGRIRPRDDDEIAPRLCRRGDLGGHVMGIRQLLVVEMAAFLGQELIFQMNRAGTRFLEHANGVHHVQGFAVSGVAIDQQRQAR